jgi:predicted RNA-binding protein associated with RNAse of E/G family
MELPEIEDIKRITYNPDDVIVVRANRHLHQEVAERIKKQLEVYFPSQQIIVLSDDLRIEVMAPEEAEA